MAKFTLPSLALMVRTAACVQRHARRAGRGPVSACPGFNPIHPAHSDALLHAGHVHGVPAGRRDAAGEHFFHRAHPGKVQPARRCRCRSFLVLVLVRLAQPSPPPPPRTTRTYMHSNAMQAATAPLPVCLPPPSAGA